MRIKSFINASILFVFLSVPKEHYGNVNLNNQLEIRGHTVLMDENIPYELTIGSSDYQLLYSNLELTQPIYVDDVRPKSKAIAITLAVTLGVFGVHRLYLGTSTRVPIIYTITLGGGFGVLVVSDIIAIIATKDLEEYASEPKVFMWAK